MAQFLADQDFNARIVAQLRTRIPALNLISVRDVGLADTPDPSILEWAAGQDRIVLSHDINTMERFAQNRINVGLPMPGLIIVRQQLTVGEALDRIEWVVQTMPYDGIEGQIITLGRLSPRV